MKGILFKPDMIRAIVEGRKTQTRRLGGLKKINQEPNYWRMVSLKNVAHFWGMIVADFAVTKPRYQVGETVYIKEPYYIPDQVWVENHYEPDGRTFYKSDNPQQFKHYWNSPLFMPTWAARYFIKITDTRCERLQTITPEDCLAEGIFVPSQSAYESYTTDYRSPTELIKSYHFLWNSINPKYPWSTNPFVWVYSFENEQF